MNDKDYADLLYEIFNSSEMSTVFTQPRMSPLELAIYMKRRYEFAVSDELLEALKAEDAAIPLVPQTLEALQSIALSLWQDSSPSREKIEMRFVNGIPINAQIVVNEATKNPIILINIGMIGVIQLAMNIYNAITSKGAHVGLAPITYDQLYDEMIELADIVANGAKDGPPEHNYSKEGSAMADINVGVVYGAVGIEVFILLHELAHVSLGHIEDIKRSSTDLADPQELTIAIVPRSAFQEIDADLQALSWMIYPQKGEGMMASDALFLYGFYILFAQLCADSDKREIAANPTFTDPEHLNRWAVVKRHFGIEQFADRAVWNLDPWFQQIVQRRAFVNATNRRRTETQAQA